jgi:hypothetical protein
MNVRHSIAIIGCMLAGNGCYATTIQSGRTPALKPSIEYDEKPHHGMLWGIAELSGPYDLDAICPHGWAEISTHTSFLNGLLDAITSGIYSPQTITVRCAGKPAGTPGPAPSPPVPAAPDGT